MNHFAHARKTLRIEINLKKTVVFHDLLLGLPYMEPAKKVKMKKSEMWCTLLYILEARLLKDAVLTMRYFLHIDKSFRIFFMSWKWVWSQHSFKLETKVMIYIAYVVMLLLYASKTWTLNKHQLSTLERFL